MKYNTGSKFTNEILIIFLFTLNLNSLFSQIQRFDLGLQSSVNLTQIEGDNLRGFKNLGYSLGWHGGYNFDDHNQLIIAGLYEKIGSDRSGTKASPLTNRTLAEIDFQVISIYLGYSKKVGDSWDGELRFRFATGLKLNHFLKQQSKLFTGRVDYNPILTDADFKKRYVSFRMSIGLLIFKNTILNLSYDHSIQNILTTQNDLPVSKLVPFYLGLGLSYYI